MKKMIKVEKDIIEVKVKAEEEVKEKMKVEKENVKIKEKEKLKIKVITVITVIEKIKIKRKIKIKIKGKKSGVYRCEGEAIDKTPPAHKLKVNAPPGLQFQKPILIISKNQLLHKKVLCFIFINLILLQL